MVVNELYTVNFSVTANLKVVVRNPSSVWSTPLGLPVLPLVKNMMQGWLLWRSKISELP